MPEPELFLLFVRPLNRAGVRYIVSGSVAAIFYGEPRLTHDVDFVVFLNLEEIARLETVFPATEFYLPSAETIRTEAAREQRGHFNIIHLSTGFKADLYLTGRDEMHAWAFRNKKRVLFEGETVVLAPPEYVIARKLEFYREGGSEKHLRDIRAMFAVSGDLIDHSALNGWINRLGLQAQLEKCRFS